VEAVRVVDGKISLPQTAINRVGDASELGLFVEGDALVLKKVHPVKLSEIAGRVAEAQPPLREIVDEVHRYRRERSDRTLSFTRGR
jgi:hypothetical protein